MLRLPFTSFKSPLGMFLLYCFYFCMVPQSQSLGSVNVTCFTLSKSTKYNLCQTVTASSGHQWPHINVFFFRCPARECHGAFKCKGDFVDSFAIPTLEECISKCNEVEDCQWFTLEKANDHCILYEECNDQFDCETCATGERKCANGYKGKYECVE